MKQAYLKSKGFDNWSEYLFDIGIDWHFNQQKRKFWAFFAKTFPPQATVTQRAVHYLARTQFGVWNIRKYLGMKGGIAA